jgi:hypothetical protein
MVEPSDARESYPKQAMGKAKKQSYFHPDPQDTLKLAGPDISGNEDRGGTKH